MPVEDYPLPQMPSASGSVDAAVFAEAVAQTVVAAGRDDTLPMLTGIRRRRGVRPQRGAAAGM